MAAGGGGKDAQVGAGLERGEVEKENVLQGIAADTGGCGGRAIHAICIAAAGRALGSSRSFLLTESIFQSQAVGKERSRLRALSQEKQHGGWQGSLVKPSPLHGSSCLAGFHSVKKKHLQLVGQDDFMQLDK